MIDFLKNNKLLVALVGAVFAVLTALGINYQPALDIICPHQSSPPIVTDDAGVK